MKSADGRFTYFGPHHVPLADCSPVEDIHRFGFTCRRSVRAGSDVMCDVLIRGRGNDIPNKTWELSGTVDKPTLSPSIDCKDCWHGYIRDGVFVGVDGKREERQ